MRKVDRELEAAIAKHGEAVPPRSYEEQFYERIKEKKNEILRA
jgi:hypothetical protein